MSYIDRFEKQQNEESHPDSTAIDCEGKLPLEIILPSLLLVVAVVVCLGVSILFLRKSNKEIQRLSTGKLSILKFDNDYRFKNMFTISYFLLLEILVF